MDHVANVGFQRSNRFIVLIKGPDISATSGAIDGKTGKIYGNEIYYQNSSGKSKPINPDLQKRLAITCTDATFSGKSLATRQFGTVGSGPLVSFPYAENYTNEITLNFNCSTDFLERHYFTKWMHQIINPSTHDVSYYDDYAKNWKILVVALPPDVSDFEAVSSADYNNQPAVYGDGPTPYGNGPQQMEMYNTLRSLYFVRLHEVYPFEISEIPVSTSSQNQILRIGVKLKFKYTDDPMTVYLQNIETLQKVGEEIKEDSPFTTFKKILRDVARYSDPKELKQLIVDKGLGELNDIFGIENVEAVAQGGQILDVYRRTPNKNYGTTQRKLIDPLGSVIGGTI